MYGSLFDLEVGGGMRRGGRKKVVRGEGSDAPCKYCPKFTYSRSKKKKGIHPLHSAPRMLYVRKKLNSHAINSLSQANLRAKGVISHLRGKSNHVRRNERK